MNPKKTTPNSIKSKPEKGTTANADSHIAFGGELHQCSAGEHPALTTNQGVPVSDNQNSLKASPRGPVLLKDFILREKITHFDHERIVHARATSVHGFFELTESLKSYTTAKIPTELLERANIGHDAGVVDAQNKDAYLDAAKTRQWDREKAVRTLA